MSWTNDRVETLKQYWSDGLSASVIAQKLGEVTRNGVIGKVHRLGLSGRANRSRNRGAARTPFFFPAGASSKKSRAQRPLRRAWQGCASTKGDRHRILPELGPPPDLPVTVQSLTALTCRWPIGDPKTYGFHFCGRAKPDGRPYCDHHAAIAFR